MHLHLREKLFTGSRSGRWHPTATVGNQPAGIGGRLRDHTVKNDKIYDRRHLNRACGFFFLWGLLVKSEDMSVIVVEMKKF